MRPYEVSYTLSLRITYCGLSCRLLPYPSTSTIRPSFPTLYEGLLCWIRPYASVWYTRCCSSAVTPMAAQVVKRLPEGDEWIYELKSTATGH